MSKFFVAALMLMGSLCVSAQSVSAQAVTQRPAPPTPPAPPAPPVPPAFVAGDDVMMSLSPEFGGRSVVKGAPYAATAVSEARQALSDGNSIERKSTVKLYRDGQGRTRQEQPGGVVFINDVVAGKRYVLNTQRKSAREVKGTPGLNVPIPPIPPTPPVPLTPPSGAPPKPPPPAPPPNLSADESRSWAEEMRRWAREFSERMRSEHGAAAREQRDAAEHVEVIRLHHADFDNLPPITLPSSLPMTMPYPAGPGTTSAIGSRNFDGVPAQGTRTAWTIAAGRVGNKLPIEIVSERWYSPELNVVVLSRHADPRSGERIYRLENIVRDEPNPELFTVPADFALKTSANPNPNPLPRDSERK